MKKLHVDEIVGALIEFCLSIEKVEMSINRIKDNSLEGINIVDEDVLSSHFFALAIFVADYSTFTVFGDTQIKNIILDKFYDAIKVTFPEYYDLFLNLVNDYAKVYTDKNKKEPLLALGLFLSQCITEEKKENIILAMKCSTEFMSRFMTTTDLLKKINSDYNIALE